MNRHRSRAVETHQKTDELTIVQPLAAFRPNESESENFL